MLPDRWFKIVILEASSRTSSLLIGVSCGFRGYLSPQATLIKSAYLKISAYLGIKGLGANTLSNLKAENTPNELKQLLINNCFSELRKVEKLGTRKLGMDGPGIKEQKILGPTLTQYID